MSNTSNEEFRDESINTASGVPYDPEIQDALDSLIKPHLKGITQGFKGVILPVLAELANRAENLTEPLPEVLATALGGRVGEQAALHLLTLLVNPNPTVRLLWRAFIRGLPKEPLEKLDLCQVCRRVFVRARKDQKCCSRRCSNLFRVRKWNKKYYESYKAQRIKREISEGGK
ncbi:MAG TPA: hypothetical protein VMW54_01110 [Terriglobia bacterium]|nr:hypothetical protein [Terriglobia bacterium]